ncbi:MAG TPA: chemotaxis protein CheW [Caulobacteraceae bacterium]|jgi:two-component system chemotaxis sensor kinase CheA
MNEDLIEIFVVEGRELLDQASKALEALQQNAMDTLAFERLFRAFHTLKGSAGLMSFAPMAEVYHLAEDRLAEAREEAGGIDDQIGENLLAVIDATEAWLDQCEARGRLPDLDEGSTRLLVAQLGGDRPPTPQIPTSLEATPRFADATTDLAEPAPVEAADSSAPTPGVGPRTLRIEGARLDDLAAATDDLAVIKNRIVHLMAEAARQAPPELAHELASVQAELDRQVQRLYGAVTRLRVTPLTAVFRRFPRLVRETSAALGKNVDLRLSGGETEADKSVVDALFEPLLHLVRNALDHGIEPPHERRARGKPERARLAISARAEGGLVMIEVEDDGRGIEPAQIRAAAVTRGVLDEAAAADLSDQAALDLIFVPGFSTARETGDLSGRGVGLDAVRSAMARIGGRVDVESEAASRTRLTLTAPLHVRLASLMTIRAGDETFGVPLESVVETVRVPREAVTPVRAGRAFVWRDQAVPLINIADLLSLPPPAPAEAFNVLIVRAGGELTAVAVDSFGERIESPLRPMSGLLAGAPGLAGATLLGDGRVLMVLDIPELIG